MATIDQITEQHAALTGASAVVALPATGLLALSGDDAGEFLQGQVTNDVESLSAGDGRYCALLTPKGKIRADMRVLRTADELLVLTEPAYLRVVRHTVDTYRIGFRFSYEDRSDDSAIASVCGPTAVDVVSDVLGGAPDGGENSTVELGGGLVAARTQLGVDLIGPAPAVERAVAAVVTAGVPAATPEALEVVRVERGIPRIGRELDENTIPQEAGINDRAVNFEKGCYVGQETVARLHYKGSPNRALRGLDLDAPVHVGDGVTAADGRELGHVGTAVVSPVNGPLALAVLRREAEVGDRVDVAGVSAVVTLPGAKT